MVNIELTEKNAKEIASNGYTIEEFSDNLMTIRNKDGENVAHLISLPELDRVFVFTKENTIYCRRVDSIEPYYGGVAICYTIYGRKSGMVTV